MQNNPPFHHPITRSFCSFLPVSAATLVRYRGSLLAGCATCATAAGLAALVLAAPAQAQAVLGRGVLGTGDVILGSATISQPNNGTVGTQVHVETSETVINWTPSDNAPTQDPIEFLPAEHRLSFIGNDDYVVLNRFVGRANDGSSIPLSRAVMLDGTVTATAIEMESGELIIDASSNVWFYNAGGIIIGANAVIDVSGLVLTTNDIVTTGGLFSENGNIRFRGMSASTSTVQVNSGAKITARSPVSNETQPMPNVENVLSTRNNAYFAIVAPRIVQRGIVTVDGSTAYVAAEQADIKISNGLFDISILVGAEGGIVIDHSGTTTTPSQSENSDQIYMVTLPKNDAVTMLVAGQIGYTEPNMVEMQPDGTIKLSAGYNIAKGEIISNPSNSSVNTLANIHLQSATFNLSLEAQAANNLLVSPSATIAADISESSGVVQFAKQTRLTGQNSVIITVGNQQKIIAGDELNIFSSESAVINAIYDSSGLGSRPSIAISKKLTLRAVNSADAASGEVVGGTARIMIDGGSLEAANISIDTNGIAAIGNAMATKGGDGRGGIAQLTVTGEGASVVTETLLIGAEGVGNSESPSIDPNAEDAGAGGAGTGGHASLVFSAGTLSLDYLSINANGIGGSGFFSLSSDTPVSPEFSRGAGGIGTGGTARIVLSKSLRPENAFMITANGHGGSGTLEPKGGLSGTGVGGFVELIIDNADVGAISPTISVDALGGTGIGFAGSGSHGGDAIGGTVRVIASGPLARLTIDPASISVFTKGGDGGDGVVDPFGRSFASLPNGGNGGSATGGTLSLFAQEGILTLVSAEAAAPSENLDFSTIRALGGNGGRAEHINGTIAGKGGNVIGPSIQLAAMGGTITSNGRAVDISSHQSAGTSGDESPAGIKSATTGGTVSIIVGLPDLEASGSNPGLVSFGALIIDASGNNRGHVSIQSNGIGTQISLASLDVTVNGAETDALLNENAIDITSNAGTIAVANDAILLTESTANFALNGAGQFRVGGSLNISADQGIDISHTTLDRVEPSIIADGDVTLTASAGNIVTDVTTSLQAGGGLVLTASGDVRFGGTRSGASDTESNGTTMIEALDGVIVIENLAAAGPVTATAHSITIRGSGNLLFQQLSADDGNINVRNDGSLSVSGGDATGDVTLASSAGTISAAKLSGQVLDFSASGDLMANDVTATGNVTLASSAGAISVMKLAGQDLDFSASGDLMRQ